jgi:large subunit ribosomal protein L3
VPFYIGEDMKKFILGKKVGMTQIMDDEGLVTPVTVLQIGPCDVVNVVKKEERGYSAVLLGYEDVKESKCNKPKKVYFQKQGVAPKKYLREFRVDGASSLEQKQVVTVDLFEKDEKVDVRSKSIGRGFAGTIKRHNFSRGPMGHGSKSHRAPGSIGAGTTPGRVIKGKKMPGHYGDAWVTVKNLLVVGVDSKTNCIYLKGAVPGKKNGLVEVSTR